MVKNMNVRSLLVGLIMLVWGNSLQGQEVSRGRLGILLGGLNGVSYDYALTNHLELGGTAAFGLGLGYGGSSKSFQFDGLTPLLELAPRYYFSRREEGQSFNKGGYLSLRLGAQIDDWTLFPSKAARESNVKSHYTLGMAPTFGWSFPLSSKSYLRLGFGFLFYRSKRSYAGDSYYAGQSYWVKTQRFRDASFLLDIAYSIAL